MENLTGRTLLNRYFLRELVGSGGMADVYLAWDQLRNAKMAVKVLRRDLASNPLFFERFAKEAEILRKLEHPNIVRLFEFEKDNDVTFIVMQWVEGTNLRQVINKPNGFLSLADYSRIFGSVCSALHYAHENEIFHCDIKPANIMLDIKGNTFETLLADFGVAQLADDFTGGGTPTYMAPEQFTGGKIDSRTDVYALGITLYVILSGGITPYSGTSPQGEGSILKERVAWEHLYSNPPSIRSVNPNCSYEMEEVILTAMQKNQQDRYSSAINFLNAFEQARLTMSNYERVSDINNISMTSPLIDQLVQVIKDNDFHYDTTRIDSNLLKNGTSFNSKNTNSFFGFNLANGINIPGRNHYILGRVGVYEGQAFSIPMGNTMIGRGSQVDLRLNDATVSRKHATIIRTPRGIYVRDESSTCGTFVNGRQISNPTLIKVGDVIQFGKQLIFEYRKG